MISFRQSQEGFTFIEIIIVTGIIAMLAGLSIASFRKNITRDYLSVSITRLSDAVRRAQVLSQSGTIKGYEGAKAYGVYFDKQAQTATLFADMDSQVGTWSAQTDKIVEQYRIDREGETDIIIETLTPAGNTLTVAFMSPTGITYINGAEAAASASVALKQQSTGYQKSLSVFRISGRIDVLE